MASFELIIIEIQCDMNLEKTKTMSMEEAIGQYVKDGSHISMGGFTINRVPMAAVHEIMRQRIKQLHLYVHSNGQGVDELIGAGCVSKIEIAYGGNGKFASTGIRFRKAIQDGTLKCEDYSNYQMMLRFLAGAMGVPFLPTLSSFGTDIIEKWGFPKDVREHDPKIPNKKLIVTENPFDNWMEASKVVLVPAIQTDVTIIHVQQADSHGTVRIRGANFGCIEQAKSARHVIVTCEELVNEEELRKCPDHNQIPFFCVDAVVLVPHGAYPTACYGYYDYDPVFLKNYATYAQNDARYREYLDKYIYNIKSHSEFIELNGGKKRLEAIKADAAAGYRLGLKRN
ncbi:MAG: CoA transferase subunit A [Syntrophales bacterium]|nr:CoA transferase subunit A [Syntrophales bacterium]